MTDERHDEPLAVVGTANEANGVSGATPIRVDEACAQA